MTAHEMAQRLGEPFCREHLILPVTPVSNTSITSTVLICPDSNESMLDFSSFRLGMLPSIQVVDRETLVRRLHETFSSSSVSENSEVSTTHDNSVVATLQTSLLQAVARGASDVHIESTETGVTIRERIDGLLHVSGNFPADRAPELFSRIKILAGLDIAERRRPQDGRLSFDGDLHGVDVRVSVIPTDRGEKAVLRLLDPERQQRSLDALGFFPEQLRLLRESLQVPNGIVLVTGPTGSGKTTTLYAALSELRNSQVNISTIEDPIEYRLEGVNQTQVKPTIGLSFAAMLRALLRQDPNIILVGEIRDRETLDIAIRASLTGHLVLSTLHTNSAVGTITRLLDMGAEPYLLSSALRLIVAQRLVRKICPDCKSKSTSADAETIAERMSSDPNAMFEGRGCARCRQTGFKGRVAMSEMISIGAGLRQAISNRASEAELTATALLESFCPMKENGRLLIENGTTTAAEVYRELHVV